MKFERTQSPTYTIELTLDECKALAEILSRSGQIWHETEFAVDRKEQNVCEEFAWKLYDLLWDNEIAGL